MSDLALEPNNTLNTNAIHSLGTVAGNCAQQTPDGGVQFWLLHSDLDAAEHSSIALPFFGHGVAQRPDSANLLVVFEKRGKGACEINLAEQSITRMIDTHTDREFYGHGCYVESEGVLLAAETVVGKKHEGVMVVRDQYTLSELDAFPTFGSRPHDVHLLADKKTLMITNGGGLYGEAERGSVVFIDVATRTLIDKYSIENSDINAGHVAISDNGNIVTVSAPRDGTTLKKPVGGITIGGKTRPFVRAAIPSLLSKKLRGETLSVCIDDTRNLAITTTPDANLTLAWDINTGAMIRRIPMNMPKGVCISVDHRYAIVSNITNKPGLDFINLDTLEIEKKLRVGIPFTGSHLFHLNKV